MNPSFWFPWRDRRPPFIYPVAMPLRTVVFEPLFRKSVRAPYVDPASLDAVAQVRRYRPAVLAGRLETLLDLYPQLDVLPTHGLVVFVTEGSHCLSDTGRDALWNTYRVPLFEEVITTEGQLVAWECEAHDGLHLAPGAQAVRCAVEEVACPCGKPGPRAINPRIAPAFNPEAAAAPLLIPAPIASAARHGAM